MTRLLLNEETAEAPLYDVVRTYISEPDRGRRNWQGKRAECDAVYANRRRIRGRRGQRLRAKRAEFPERSFAHGYDTGGMRRTHLRGHPNILKRLLVHMAGRKVSLVLRRALSFAAARGLQGRSAGVGDGLAVFPSARQARRAMARVIRC